MVITKVHETEDANAELKTETSVDWGTDSGLHSVTRATDALQTGAYRVYAAKCASAINWWLRLHEVGRKRNTERITGGDLTCKQIGSASIRSIGYKTFALTLQLVYNSTSDLTEHWAEFWTVKTVPSELQVKNSNDFTATVALHRWCNVSQLHLQTTELCAKRLWGFTECNV